MQSTLTVVVLVECTTSSESYFQQLQISLVLDYKLRVVPVGSPQEAAKIITQMVLVRQCDHLTLTYVCSVMERGNCYISLFGMHSTCVL